MEAITHGKPFHPLHNEFARVIEAKPIDIRATSVDGGHMAYGRWLIDAGNGGKRYFAKGHRPELFTDPVREGHARQYLEKEQAFFAYLRSQGFKHVPEFSELVGGSLLVMDAYSPADNWQWEAEFASDQKSYIEAALGCFDDLQATPIASPEHYFPKRIMKVYMEEGWDFLNEERIAQIQQRMALWQNDFHPETAEWAARLSPRIAEFIAPGRALYDQAQQLYLCHHDARQANFAYHPERGVKLIDWSWADVGFKNADSTMLLIDLTKSEVDVTPYLATHFNPEHALLLMGHWLGRSIEPTRDGDTTVRFHQLTSAITAFELLTLTGAI